MRLAFVSRRFWPLVGEPEYVAANLAQTFQQNGLETEILSSRSFPGWPPQFRFRGCTVHRLPAKFPAFRIRRQFEKSVSRFLRERQSDFDAVLFFQPASPPWELLIQVNKLGLKSIVRLESTCFGVNPEREVSELAKAWHDLPAQNRCRFVSSSQAFVRQLKTALPELHWIPEGIPSEPWNSPQLEDPADESLHIEKMLAKSALSRSHPMLRIRETDKLAVFAGPINSAQRLDAWIASWKRVRREFAGAKIWILGEGNYQQQLWEQIIVLGLDDHVVMGGIFDDLSSVFDAADVFLLGDARRLESPFVLLAQSRRLPVIAHFDFLESDDSFSRDWGMIPFTGDSVLELGRMVTELFKGEIDLSKIVESARLRIQNSHSMSSCSSSYLELLNSMD